MSTKKGKILVVGSIVFDKILAEEFYGGTGANIAYGLSLLGAKPLLFSLAGMDFKKDFGPHLKKAGIDLRIHFAQNGKTASFVCVNDKKGNQREEWKPNVYKKINQISISKTIPARELNQVTIAIFSPGTPDSTYRHLREFRNFAPLALAIFDPGQMINFYSKKQLIECINLANITILNESEYSKAKNILEKDPAIFFTKLSKIIIKTKGAKGSEIFQNKKMIKINAIRPRRVLDTTGAGDAYRAGLIFGLWRGKSLVKSCVLGARMASANVEFVGCQQYKVPKFPELIFR